MKFAYFVKPHIGGTYTVFTQLRSGLAAHGITVEWLSLQRHAQDGYIDWSDAMAHGAFVPVAASARQQDEARALEVAIRLRGYDGIFVNVLADPVETNIVHYLPNNLLRVMIVHNITPGTYAAASAIRNRVHATACVSDRCRKDLISKYGFSPSQTFVVPNAVDATAVTGLRRTAQSGKGLRVIALGRIEDSSKGVFWLPKILAGLPDDVDLTIAGDGPDLPELKQRFSGFGSRVRFLGYVSPEKVLPLMMEHDAFIMPSRFEGFGITIVEAMATGCVPVVSRISGVTDTIIDHGKNGLLFQVGDVVEAIDFIKRLRDGDVRRQLSAAGQERALSQFNIELMAARYADILHGLQGTQAMQPPALPMEAWALPSGLRPGLRRLIPRYLKNWLRQQSERL
ncbi:hypothetical protein ASG42_21670 [Rhizobium sp. Leaf391]|uniref:glycosyltransferase family 4 protein n=1 Tax=Rhizobium sp. Leaf391 TaxID=1736360 RepID=UPI0007134364|nr:glycosyltransferase family 4 protein [Rhizobium sp. Leaf391]KQT05132.1 hypothetical protein ASG42_21670 [Rhizobium sp. Leaf391]